MGMGRPVSEQGREDLELAKNWGWCIAIELGKEKGDKQIRYAALPSSSAM